MIFSSDNKRSVPLKKINSSLIPYVSLFDAGCVITKNGNLIQIIKLKGFASDSSLSNALRKTIKSINREDIAIWVHTFRRKVNVSLKWHETGDFSDELHEAYIKNSDAFINYVNEVYISIVSLAPQTNFNKSVFDFINNTFNVAPKDSFKIFNRINEDLNQISNTIINSLNEFDAQKLYSNEEDSSLLTFLYLLVTFQNKQTNLSLYEISDYLSYKSNIAFGINAFEIRNDNYKKVGTVIGIKEHKKLFNLSHVNELMNANFEFLITEVMHFIGTGNAKSNFEHQNYLLEVSNEENFKNIPYFTEISSASEDRIEFCYHHIQIIPLAHNLDLLETNTQTIVSIFSNMGLVFVRYDIALEKMLWFRLPGNSPLTPLKRANHLNNICDFTEIYGYFSGLTKNIIWNHPITIFFSVEELVHIFNFHYKSKSGNTIMIGNNYDSERTILRNFLISESRKNKIKVLILDNLSKSEVFIKALNGYYTDFNYEDSKINCLSIKKSEALEVILAEISGNILNSDNIKLLANKLLDNNVASEEIHEFLRNIDESFTNSFLANIFNEEENIDWSNDVIGINIDKILTNPKNAFMVIYCLIYRFLSTIVEQPFIIAFENMTNFIHLFSTPLLEKLLNDVTSMNGIAILAIDSDKPYPKNFDMIIEKYITTQLFLPNFLTKEQISTNFLLGKEDIHNINYINHYDQCVFLKQDKKSIVLQFNIKTIKEKNVLYSEKKKVKLMHESINESDADPKNWIPLYLKKCEN